MTSDGGVVADVSPWLCQGDLFRTAPVLHYPDLSKDFIVQLRMGPAMLVNHDCALDKLKKGEATIERFSFLSIRNLAVLPEDRQQLTRTNANELAPFEAHYLGHLVGLGESYVVLSDPWYVPANYFGAHARTFAEAGNEKRLAIRNHDSRFARLGDASLALFRHKWNAYWTRTVPRDEDVSAT